MTTPLTPLQRTVYLAGPGVFFPDPHAWGQRMTQACHALDLCGLYPLDQHVPDGLAPAAMRHWIAQANYALIRRADVVFADLRAFRSCTEPDSGTAFEVGFAHALGKPVWLWLPDCTPDTRMKDRVPGAHGEPPRDADGLFIEDFDAPHNLMLWEAAAGISYGGEVEDALAEMARVLLR